MTPETLREMAVEALRSALWDGGGVRDHARYETLVEVAMLLEASPAEPNPDTKRLDWLGAHDGYLSRTGDRWLAEVTIGNQMPSGTGATPREAIDAAMTGSTPERSCEHATCSHEAHLTGVSRCISNEATR